MPRKGRISCVVRDTPVGTDAGPGIASVAKRSPARALESPVSELALVLQVGAVMGESREPAFVRDALRRSILDMTGEDGGSEA